MSNKGKLGIRIGVNGYAPDGIQYDVDVVGDGKASNHSASNKKNVVGKKSLSSDKKIDEYIKKISSYRAGGEFFIIFFIFIFST